MIYVKRNDNHKIIDLVFKPIDDYEEISIQAQEITDFINASEDSAELIQEILNRLDLKMIRVIEDVIELMIKKKLILMTELPVEVQNQLLFKQRLRSMNTPIKTIADEEEMLLL